MTRGRRLGGATGLAVVLAIAGAAVSGCTGGDAGGSGESASVAPTRDAGQATADGDARRERMPLSDDAVAANRELVPEVSVALDALRGDGEVTPDAVAARLSEIGLADVQTISDARSLTFGAMGVEGGCFYGEISAQTVQVEVGGPREGGGCVPGS
ncbi:hypothetical protein [Microbacterium invictum]|uniref:Lipoprotein n=1 Tax=Microbacterium invictum TaxID=515415 RepID=A0ABZ0V7F0_9MICO|nr:hypothetical protein [Microbacterium invictum]WQB69159.1 hypothetical protein T9R20_10605 [Microbacterium invictum]